MAIAADLFLALFVVLLVVGQVWLVRGWPALVYALPLVPILVAGDRYRVRVDGAGVHFTRYRAWFAVDNRSYGLDVEIGLYESWDADGPEGLELTSARFVRGETESGCFGPSFSEARLRQAHRQLVDALEAERALTPTTPLPLRHAWLAAHVAALDVVRAERNAQGRLQRIDVTHDIPTRDALIPAGSVCVLNPGACYRDPRRDDELAHVELGADAPLFDGLVARAGSEIRLDEAEGLVVARRAFASPLRLAGGLSVEGESVAFRARRPVGYTLAEPFRMGRVLLPRGTAVFEFESHAALPMAPIHCTLREPLGMPGYTLEPGDSLAFGHEGRIQSVHVRDREVVGPLASGLNRVDSEGRLTPRRRRK